MLLDYIHHANPTGARDMLSKLATFATARGWTVELQTNVDWEDTGGSYYDWVGGHDNYFLQIRSLGYGSQDLTYRFWVDPLDATEDLIYIHPVTAGDSVYSHALSVNPANQNKWGSSNFGGSGNRYDVMSLPHSTFSDVWIMGNDKVIAVVMKVSSTHFVSFAIGTFELVSEFQSVSGSEAQCRWTGQECSISSATQRPWTNIDSYLITWYNCWSFGSTENTHLSTCRHIWWNGAAGNTVGVPNVCRYNLRGKREADPGVDTYIYFNTLPVCCVYNDWTQKWTLMRPTVYVANTKLDGTWVAAGWLPMYYLSMTNLNPGDIITFGSEEYIVFPTLMIDAPYGVAFRVV